MKIFSLMIFVLFISGCAANPPTAKEVSGQWKEINTTVLAIKRGTVQ